MVHVLLAIGLFLIAGATAGFSLGSQETITAPGVEGSGMTAEEQRTVGCFSAIELTGCGTVRIRKGPRETVTVKANKNLLPVVQTYVRGETLIIEPKQGINILDYSRLEIIVYVDKIVSLDINGAGTIRVDEDLTVQSYRAKINGSGKIDAVRMTADRVDAIIKGSGKIYTSAESLLRVWMAGSGLVRYRGNPKIDHSIAGTGKIKRIKL